jgi:hypothetical protein
MCGAQLLQRDLRLGLEDDIVWDLGFISPVRVVCPGFGQIELEASTAPSASIFGSTIWRTLASTASSDHGAMATKCSNDWCFAAVRAGAVSAAIGSTLLRSPGSSSPVQ